MRTQIKDYLIWTESVLVHNRFVLGIGRRLAFVPSQYSRDHDIPYDKIFSRWQLINLLIEKNGFTKYLEVGVSDPSKCFDKIEVQVKVGVDPDPSAQATFKMTSDEFFAQNTSKFDVVFVDGLHHANQTERDITNALDVIGENGFVVCHDMSPAKESHQLVPRVSATWNGDCWRAWVRLRNSRPDLEMLVVKADEGVGVIWRGTQKTLNIPNEISWPLFTKYRKYLLNLVSVTYFEKWLDE